MAKKSIARQCVLGLELWKEEFGWSLD